MRLSRDQTDDVTLKHIAAEAIHLLVTGDFRALVDRFGYAVAAGRDTVRAVEEDLEASLAETGATRVLPDDLDVISVLRLGANATGLLATTECTISTDGTKPILVELVVSGTEDEPYFTLEQISAAA